MKIAWNNELKSANTLTSTYEDSNYPVENIFSKWKRSIYKATAATDTITATWTAGQSIDAVLFSYHNLTGMTVKLYDSTDTLLYTHVVTFPDGADTIGEYFDRVDGVFKATFEISGVANLYLGVLFIGKAISAEKQAGQDLPLISSDVVTSSSDFQYGGKSGSVVRAANVTIEGLTSTQRKNIEEAYYSLGLIFPWFLDLWDQSHDHFEPVYGVFTGNLESRHEITEDIISFGFQEAN